MLYINPQKLLDLLKKFLPSCPTIIEAGAFTGNDTIRLSKQWPGATIHAFEPVPAIYQQLQEKTNSYPNIQCHPLALASFTGTLPFYCAFFPDKPSKLCPAGSLLKPKERLLRSSIRYQETTLMVPTITLKDWQEAHQVSSIDFLWLDAQGNEFDILLSAQPLLPQMSAVYIEVHFIEAYEKQPSYQAIDTWLKAHNFEPYAKDFANETDWFFGNVLYINKCKLKTL